MTTLQQIINSVKDIKIDKVHTPRKKEFARQFLGKFKGIIPNGKSSTDYIRELRDTLYDKTK